MHPDWWAVLMVTNETAAAWDSADLVATQGKPPRMLVAPVLQPNTLPTLAAIRAGKEEERLHPSRSMAEQGNR